MTDITAIILAAGLGLRMGPRGRLMPKCMLRVGGETLIGRSVAALRARGVGRIVLVTGHLHEQFEAAFGAEIELAYNPHYATTGSLRSLMTGLQGVKGACLILEGDLIYAPQVLDAVDGSANRFLVSTPTGAGDEQYVWADPATGRMIDVSKDIRRQPMAPLGEMIGITALTADAVARMKRVGAEVLAHDPEEHYEPGLVALSREAPIDCPLLRDVPWAEVDDEAMLARAEAQIWPRIRAWQERGRAGDTPAA